MLQELRADNTYATLSRILQLYLACVLCHAALSMLEWYLHMRTPVRAGW